MTLKLDLIHETHKRGCEGRNYTCTCGYDDRVEAALSQKPSIWFVKDFADGWIPFNNEADARREVEATGAVMMAGYQVPTDHAALARRSIQRFPTIISELKNDEDKAQPT